MKKDVIIRLLLAILMMLLPMWIGKILGGITQWSTFNVFAYMVNGFVQGISFMAWLEGQRWAEFLEYLKDKKYKIENENEK